MDMVASASQLQVPGSHNPLWTSADLLDFQILYDSTATTSTILDTYNGLETFTLMEQKKGQFLHDITTGGSESASEFPPDDPEFRLAKAIQLASNKLLPMEDMDNILLEFEELDQLQMIKVACSQDDLSTAQSFSESVLCSAVRLEMVELVQYLLVDMKNPVNPNLSDKRFGYLFCSIIGKLREYGDDYYIHGDFDATDMDIEASNSSSAVKIDADAEDVVDSEWDFAVKQGLELLDIFLEAGVNPNLGRPKTPLQLAASFLNSKLSMRVLQSLLSAGARVDLTTVDCVYTPLQQLLLPKFPINYNHKHDSPAGEYPRGTRLLVRRLLLAGANVNARPPKPDRGFKYRSGYGDFIPGRRVPCPLDSKDYDTSVVSPFERDGWMCRFTTLQLAASRSQYSHYSSHHEHEVDLDSLERPNEYSGIVRDLIVHKGRYDHRARIDDAPGELWGRTALQAAAEAGCLETVLMLLAAGADVNELPSVCGGLTSLQAAAKGGHYLVVEALLDHLGGAADHLIFKNEPTAKVNGMTALQAAVQKGGSSELVRLLLDHGAKPDVCGTSKQYFWLNFRGSAQNGNLYRYHDTNRSPLQTVLSRLFETIHYSRPSTGIHMDDDSESDSEFDEESITSDLQIVKILLKAGASLFFQHEYDRMNLASRRKRKSFYSPAELIIGIDDERLNEIVGPYLATQKNSPRDLIRRSGDRGNRILQSILSYSKKIQAWYCEEQREFDLSQSRKELVAKFVANGARVRNNCSRIDKDRQTALQIAQQTFTIFPNADNEEIFRMILAAGGDINTNSPWSETVVQYAVRMICTDPDESFRIPLDIQDPEGDYPAIQALINLGADINARPDFRGLNALQIAVKYNNEDLVAFLLKAGADPNAEHSDRKPLILSTLGLACRMGNYNAVKLLLQHNADVNPERVADAELFDKFKGSTPLQVAAKYGHLDIVKLLVDSGAIIDAGPSEVWAKNALQMAISDGNIEMAKLLLELGADVNAPPCSSGIGSRSALQAASEVLDLSFVRFLVECWKADVNMKAGPRAGVTALQAAAKSGAIGIVAFLLEQGADPNGPAPVKDGHTALDWAAACGRLDIAVMLLENGANRTKKTFNRQFGNNGSHRDIVEFWEYNCRSAINLATKHGHHAVADLLLKYHQPPKIIDVPLEASIQADPFGLVFEIDFEPRDILPWLDDDIFESLTATTAMEVL